jgi:hypothetical protein
MATEGLPKPTTRRAPRQPATGGGALGEAASRRLGAAAAAAGAAASGNTAPDGDIAAAATEPATAEPARVEASPVETSPVEIAAAVPVQPPVSPARAMTSDADTGASSAAAAAVAAVSAAIAATAATKAAHPIAPTAHAPGDAAAAKPPVTVEGYVRAPGRDIPGLIRAHHETSEAAAAPILPMSPPPSPDHPARKYMRPAPAVPGITRADEVVVESTTEAVKPPPLFSNEGVVRQYESQQRGGVAGFFLGIFAALLGAGTALGHALASVIPDGKTRVIAGPAISANADSPDFDRYGSKRPRGRGRRRAAGVMLVVGVLGVFGFTIALSAALPPAPNATVRSASGSPGATFNNLVADATLLPEGSTPETSVDPTDVLIGDDPLPPGATRRPTPKPTPKPTAAPTAAPTDIPAPGPTDTAVPTGGPPSSPHSGTNTSIDCHTHPDTQADTHPDTQADTHPDTHPDTQADTHPDTQADTQADTHPDADCSACQSEDRYRIDRYPSRRYRLPVPCLLCDRC